MEEVSDTVRRLASGVDENGRKKLIDDLRDLSYSIETPDDTLHRLKYMNLQIATVRIGIDLKLFDLLAASSDPMTLEQLQRKTGAAPVLLGRLLRYLASIATIKETGVNEFASTNITDALAIPGNQASVYHMFDTLGPMFQALPNVLADNKYHDITENTKTAHQVGHNTPLSAFEWFTAHPMNAAYFNEYMAHRRKDQAICWDVYPVEEEAKDWGSDAALLVDIGGNIGHQCAEFKSRFPKIPGRVILEDLPGPISMARTTVGVEKRIHDMFTPQPIIGAKFYYLRTVLHDWPDDKCREILQNIIPAMEPESVILLDETVLPDQNVYWRATSLDLTMMAVLGARERTQTQWAEILDSVGLKIAKVYTYAPLVSESVMAVVRK